MDIGSSFHEFSANEAKIVPWLSFDSNFTKTREKLNRAMDIGSSFHEFSANEAKNVPWLRKVRFEFHENAQKIESRDGYRVEFSQIFRE